MAPALSRIERRLRAVEHALFQLRQEFESMSSGSPDDRWLRLLTLVEEAGGRVPSAEWGRLGTLVGYDPRGLGGFFRGNEPSMAADGDDRVLTTHGIAHLDAYGRKR
jgi:hypothetical protein